MFRRLLLLVTCCILVGALFARVSPQVPTVEEDLAEADQLVKSFDYDRALALFRSVAERTRGTPTEAECLMEMAYLEMAAHNDLAATRVLYQQVLDRFPGTEFSHYARLNLSDLALAAGEVTFEGYLSQLSQAVQEAGGPSFEAIWSGTAGSPTPVSWLEREAQRRILCNLYIQAGGSMSNHGRYEDPLNRRVWLEKGLALDLYIRLHMADLLSWGCLGSLRSHLKELGFPGPHEDDLLPPRLTVLTPSEGGTASPGSTLRFQLSDGTIGESQLDPRRLVVKLDGQDITSLLELSGRLRTDGQDPFEERTYSYALPGSLAAGLHTVELKAVDAYGNELARSWSFSVSPPNLSLSLEVLSKHVKPRRGETARVLAVTSAPSLVSYTVYRGSPGQTSGPVIFSAARLDNPTGSLELVWNGLDDQGRQVDNGSYMMEVSAQDQHGQTGRASAHLVVNF